MTSKRALPQRDSANAAEMKLAGTSSEKLARYVRQDLKLKIVGKDGESITLPAAAVKLLVRMLSEMAEGHAVTVMTEHRELTTQQAAEVLGVSRPFLIKLLDEGQIPSRKVGTHRRVRLDDLASYRRDTHRLRLEALEELAAQAQELKMGY